MRGLPALNEDDARCFDQAMDELLRRSEATAAIIIDNGGPLLRQRGTVDGLDTTTIAALAAGSFSATQAMAEHVGETNFSSLYQQGESRSIFLGKIDDSVLLVVIFKAETSAGAVKYYAADAIRQIAAQLERARQRDPGVVIDAVSELTDSSIIFSRGTNPPPPAS